VKKVTLAVKDIRGCDGNSLLGAVVYADTFIESAIAVDDDGNTVVCFLCRRAFFSGLNLKVNFPRAKNITGTERIKSSRFAVAIFESSADRTLRSSNSDDAILHIHVFEQLVSTKATCLD